MCWSQNNATHPRVEAQNSAKNYEIEQKRCFKSSMRNQLIIVSKSFTPYFRLDKTGTIWIQNIHFVATSLADPVHKFVFLLVTVACTGRVSWSIQVDNFGFSQPPIRANTARAYYRLGWKTFFEANVGCSFLPGFEKKRHFLNFFLSIRFLEKSFWGFKTWNGFPKDYQVAIS